MTLPSPDRPSVNTTIETIVDDIYANINYLDGTVPKIKLCSTSRTTAEGNGTVTVTGIGFEPSFVFFFSTDTYCQSVGIYSPSTTYNNVCMYRRYVTGGEYVLPALLWYMSGGRVAVSYFSDDGYSTYVSLSCAISSTNSDGFVLSWLKGGLNAKALTLNVRALCIK